MQEEKLGKNQKYDINDKQQNIMVDVISQQRSLAS
jgi:hypothetical protein